MSCIVIGLLGRFCCSPYPCICVLKAGKPYPEVIRLFLFSPLIVLYTLKQKSPLSAQALLQLLTRLDSRMESLNIPRSHALTRKKIFWSVH